jgi:hypothetical protein
MLIAISHFVIGFTTALAMALIYARLSGESNSTGIPFGLISGIICATLATFASPWLTPLVLLVLGAASHHEYRATRADPAVAKQNARSKETYDKASDHASDPDT